MHVFTSVRLVVCDDGNDECRFSVPINSFLLRLPPSATNTKLVEALNKQGFIHILDGSHGPAFVPQYVCIMVTKVEETCTQ